MEKIAIIIVNWNTGHLLSQCLQSIANLPPEETAMIDEVIVIDNASSDTSLVKAEVAAGRNRNEPRVRFIKNRQNIGFAAANNLGINRVVQRQGKNLTTLLLNPDTRLTPGALRELMGTLERRNKAGIVGPKLLNDDGTIQPSIRHFPSYKNLGLMMLKLSRLINWGKFDYGQEQAVDQVMGAAFLIRGETLEQVGGLDEKFWIWFEEVDYCQRAKAAGWEVVYTPRAKIYHYGAISFNQLAGFYKTGLWLKSLLYYAEKHIKPWQAMSLKAMLPLAWLITMLISLWHPRKITAS